MLARLSSARSGRPSRSRDRDRGAKRTENRRCGCDGQLAMGTGGCLGLGCIHRTVARVRTD
eukprot:364556-Chlamydomonas_euryale.AAC.12